MARKRELDGVAGSILTCRTNSGKPGAPRFCTTKPGHDPSGRLSLRDRAGMVELNAVRMTFHPD